MYIILLANNYSAWSCVEGLLPMLCLQASNKALGQFENIRWSFCRESKVRKVTVLHTTESLFRCLYRLVHAFTAAGIIPSQYIHLSSFAEMGVVGKWYINNGMYFVQEIVHMCDWKR